MTGVAQDRAAGATATDRGARNLRTRVVAALVLAPIAIAVAFAGGWWWALLATAIAIGLYIEWLSVVGAGQPPWPAVAGSLALAAAGVGVAIDLWSLDIAAIVAGLVAVVPGATASRLWIAGGLVYAALALVASILVRADPQAGFVALVFVLLVVWGTDIGGYFAGRGIGGPKLWPRISPKKTWAGAIGGLAISTLIGLAAAAFGFGDAARLLALAALLSVVSQLGDLFESAVKRKFGVKDSGHLIPGHGGLLDRLDGFVAAIVVAAVIGFVHGGADGVGRGLLMW